jgi:competence protein ComEC
MVVYFFFFQAQDAKLTVSFLDVGQGDAILITSPTGKQVLIDGGRDRGVLRTLGKELGLFDRHIELVIETHPDADHIGGLASVFERYQIDGYLKPGIPNDTSPTLALIDAVNKEKDIQELVVRRGTRISIGGGAYLEVLFPDRDVAGLETNTGSVVTRLVYGDTSFLLTGDSPSAIESYLIYLDKEMLVSDVLKAGHHGSRTSTSEEYLEVVDPTYVVISAGKDNSYGHPHEEVVERIQASGAKILKTMGEGSVVFESDGTTLTIKE